MSVGVPRAARELPSMGSPEFTKICVAGTTGSQMVEPVLRLRERHLVTGNSFENVGRRAPRALGIGKFLAQTSTQHLKKALFVTLGILHRAQKFLHSGDCSPLHRQHKIRDRYPCSLVFPALSNRRIRCLVFANPYSNFFFAACSLRPDQAAISFHE